MIQTDCNPSIIFEKEQTYIVFVEEIKKHNFKGIYKCVEIHLGIFKEQEGLFINKNFKIENKPLQFTDLELIDFLDELNNLDG